MNVVVPCEYGKDLIENSDNIFLHTKSMGNFSNTQGQITPRPVVGSG